MPFLATENIIMAAVKKGANRQEMHESFRKLSHEVSYLIKQEGKDNDLLDRIAKDDSIPLTSDELHLMLKSNRFTGSGAGCRIPPRNSFEQLELIRPFN